MIPGISDVRRLTRLGKIRLGEKKIARGSGKEYPAALDHFNFKDVPELEEIYGKNCKEIDIVFPVENPDVFFSQKLECWRASGLFCACNDGKMALRVRLQPKEQSKDPVGEAWIKKEGLTVKPGTMYDIPCPHHDCSFFKNDYCSPIGRLMFMVPKAPKFGCYEIDTSSWNSIVNVNNYARDVKEACGRISNVPLKLRLVEHVGSHEGQKVTVYVLKLEYQGKLEELTAMRRKELPPPAPDSAMPTDKPIPDDLIPSAGQKLEEKLSGNGKDEKESAKPQQVQAARDIFGTGSQNDASPQTTQPAQARLPWK